MNTKSDLQWVALLCKVQGWAAYARDAAQRQPIYAELAAGTMKNAYNIALADWFHAPKIGRIDLQSGLVRIQATDNVRVTGVNVAVLNEQGMLLEQGESMQVDECMVELYSTKTIGRQSQDRS